MAEEKDFMAMALDLARLGLGRTSPNPMVGAVIVKNGKIIGQGFHQKAGMAHAEVEALKNVGAGFPRPILKTIAGGETPPLRNATLYVTLEPCCHHGRTPPCVDAIIQAGIKHVVVGMKDPDEKVSGQGIRLLKKHGIKVTVGVMEKECRELNAAYIKHRQKKMPYVTLKMASTLDGKIALPSGDSKWITGEVAREMGHVLRDQHDAIMVGIGTIQKDDPQLTCRLGGKKEAGRDPIRVVVDSQLSISPKAKILRQISVSPTWLATTLSEKDVRVKNFEKKFSRVSFEILSCRSDKSKLDLKDLLKKLAERGVVSVLVEGGPTLVTALLKQKLVDRVVHFISPTYLGEGLSCINNLEIKKLTQRIGLKDVQVRLLGQDSQDLMVEGVLSL